jgi:hypothetical protein
MQASGRATKRVAGTAVEVFEVQDDFLKILRIVGESMKGLGRTALVNNRLSNLGRKAFDMLRVVPIFASTAAAFR